jgi:hypothetical protein
MKNLRALSAVILFAIAGVFLAFQTGYARLTSGTTSDNDQWCMGVSGAEICVDSSGNLIPTTASDTTVGTSALPFATVYTDDLTTGDDLTVTDDLTVSGDATVALTLGVGDLTPDAKLEVQSLGAGETYALLVSSDNGSTNELAYDTANDQLEISADVGIGGDAATPDARLEVASKGAGETYSLLLSSANGSTNEIAFDTANDEVEILATVGIGDASPDAMLEVVSEGIDETYALLVSSTNGSTNEIAFDTGADELEISAKVSIGQTVDSSPDGTVEITPAAGDEFSLIVSSVGSAVSHLAVRSARNGHLEVAGSAPTPINCGTTPSVVGSDVAGKFTIGSSATENDGCTLNFTQPFAQAPACIAQCEDVTAIVASTTSVSGVAFKLTTTVDSSGDVCSYFCIGQDAD